MRRSSPPVVPKKARSTLAPPRPAPRDGSGGFRRNGVVRGAPSTPVRRRVAAATPRSAECVAGTGPSPSSQTTSVLQFLHLCVCFSQLTPRNSKPPEVLDVLKQSLLPQKLADVPREKHRRGADVPRAYQKARDLCAVAGLVARHRLSSCYPESTNYQRSILQQGGHCRQPHCRRSGGNWNEACGCSTCNRTPGWHAHDQTGERLFIITSSMYLVSQGGTTAAARCSELGMDNVASDAWQGVQITPANGTRAQGRTHSELQGLSQPLPRDGLGFPFDQFPLPFDQFPQLVSLDTNKSVCVGLRDDKLRIRGRRRKQRRLWDQWWWWRWRKTGHVVAEHIPRNRHRVGAVDGLRAW